MLHVTSRSPVQDCLGTPAAAMESALVAEMYVFPKGEEIVVFCKRTGWGWWSGSWVVFTVILEVPPSCPAAQPVLPISHQPKQYKAEGGIDKIKINRT